ncbi:ubiquitination network signaling protein [Ophiostoma piceae UAMH 11346]|uniref:Ubiquitination network signaling protein n=1 Tax=Ophiostoma piceae (strain UAMH 11346) TaxID=1262450 RepID=S3C553_OPHP1|nr:ubiquitination network signaling protein [Ophiostoma piceae UAMH 11346]
MPGLKNSRWALHGYRDVRDARSSSVPAPSTRNHAVDTSQKQDAAPVYVCQSNKGAGSSAAELSRYSKIVRRMKWKLPFLDLAYRQATAEHGPDASAKAEAELMFKLDFFDYYMLCERALVHLQGVFGIVISRGSTVRGPGEPQPASGQNNGKYTHRYHANVLGALDVEDNPLHTVLGVGDIRWHLARAKDLRNHWKNADDDTGKMTAATGSHSKKLTRPAPLSSYDLAGILTSIHQGLDQAYVVASEFAATCAEKQVNNDAAEINTIDMDMATDDDNNDDDEWGFMVDAMDWEAV